MWLQSYFEQGMVVGVGLSIWETVEKFSHITISRFYREWSGKRENIQLVAVLWVTGTGSLKLDDRRLGKRCLVWWDLISWDSDGRVRIWHKQHKSTDPSCLLRTVQAAIGAGGEGDISLAHCGPISTARTLFKCHSLFECCCKPFPPLYDYSVLVL